MKIFINKINFASTKQAKQNALRLPSFSHFPLHKSIQNYLNDKDLHTPTYIQYALMAKIYQKSVKEGYLLNSGVTNPIHIVSSTGSGKTLAYTLPLINTLKQQQEQLQQTLTRSQRPRGLIITSTKQLVLQGKNVCKQVSHFSKLKTYGIGIGRGLQQQKQKIYQGVDILVTPYIRFKRMLDKRQAFLSGLSWIVIDQMDTLFQSQRSMVNDLFDTIITPKLQQQNPPQVLFSSTTNPPPLKQYLQKKIKNLTQIIDQSAHVNLQNIKHQFLYCSDYNKHSTLLDQVKRSKQKTMIFCNTVTSLHELQYFLNQSGIPTITLHSQLNKNTRIKNYQYFRDLQKGQKGILLSTDLGARGLHFPNLKKVINYDFPLSTCDYLQRVGRTGRAGQKGLAVSIYFKKDLDIINQLKDASFNTPLKISNSAYGLKNRQQTKRPGKFQNKK